MKVLQLKMTFSEAMEYINNHKRWRLPTFNESKEIQDGVFWVNETDHVKKNGLVETHSSSAGNTNIIFKLKVLLVPRLNNIQTGTVFYSTQNGPIIRFLDTWADYDKMGGLSPVFTKEGLGKMLSVGSKLDLSKVFKIYDAMGKHDIVVFKKGD